MLNVTLLTVLSALICLQLSCIYGTKIAEADERKEIIQFFKYVDNMKQIMIDNISDIGTNFLRSLLNRIPEKDRGSSSDILRRAIEKEEIKKRSSKIKGNDENNVMEAFGVQLEQNMLKNEQEDRIIQAGLFGKKALFPRLMEEQEKFLNKINHASDVMITKFSLEGFGRHEKIFALLTELKNTTNPEDQAILFSQLEEIYHDYVDNRK